MIIREQSVGRFLFFGWLLLLTGVVISTGYNGLYGQDSHEYFRYALRLVDLFRKGIPPGTYFWPVHFPLAGALLSILTGGLLSLQAVSVLSAATLLFYLSKFLMIQFPGREREVLYYTITFMGLSPYFFRYSVSCMSDAMAMALSGASLYYAWSCLRTQSVTAFLAAFFLAGVSVFTRYATLLLLLPPMTGLCLHAMRLFRPRVWLAGLMVTAFSLCVHVFFKQDQYADILHHSVINEWSFSNFFRSEFAISEGRLTYPLPNVVAACSFLVHPGYVFPGVVFLSVWLFDRSRKPLLSVPTLTAGMVLYTAFVAGMNFQNKRYLVVLVPIYLVMVFPSYLKIVARLGHRKNWLVTAGSLSFALQVILCVLAFIPFREMNRVELAVAEKVNKLHPDTLYTFGIEGAVRNYGYSGVVISLFDSTLTRIPQRSMLLFNLKQTEQQWSGKNPMNNYWFLVKYGAPKKIESPGGGWELYEIGKTGTDTNPGVSGK